MRVLNGNHQDMQHVDGRGNVLKYVSTYAPKMSSSFGDEFLTDQASDFSIARKLVCDVHPLEPEMWMYLAGALFRPCRYGGTLVERTPPVPDVAEKPEWVRKYEACTWRSETMSLLEYLRKSNDAGEIVKWVRDKHASAKRVDIHTGNLKDFADTCAMNGEKIIALDFVSRRNEKLFGQWFTAQVPFRHLEDLLDAEIVAKVPKDYVYFACALKHKPDYWGDDNAIRADLELEAHRETFIATLVDMLKCFRHVTDLFLRGELRLDDPHYVDKLMVRDRYFADSHFQDDKGQKHKFNKQQRFLRDSIRDYMDASLEADRAQTDEEYDRLVTQTAALRRVIAGLGVPGSGKTTVIDSSIEEGHSKRARMLYLLPTGQQAVRMRLRHPTQAPSLCEAWRPA